MNYVGECVLEYDSKAGPLADGRFGLHLHFTLPRWHHSALATSVRVAIPCTRHDHRFPASFTFLRNVLIFRIPAAIAHTVTSNSDSGLGEHLNSSCSWNWITE
jgi:hypothetical protein